MLIGAHAVGVLLLVHTRRPHNLKSDELEAILHLGSQAAVAVENARLITHLQHATDKLVQAYDTTLIGWAKALELRDRETEGHIQRVTNGTMSLARSLGIGEDELVHIYQGALLHDIGKMGIPDTILKKPGHLSEEEWQIMRLHPVYAYEWLSPIAYLHPALEIPYCHHEKWDGSGYPRGLRGQDIPLAAAFFRWWMCGMPYPLIDPIAKPGQKPTFANIFEGMPADTLTRKLSQNSWKFATIYKVTIKQTFPMALSKR